MTEIQEGGPTAPGTGSPYSTVPPPYKPQVRVASFVGVPHAWRSTYPRHVLHEDGQSLLGTVPQAAVVLHYALVLQVLQQLDLTLQSAHLLREGPGGYPDLQGPVPAHLESAPVALISDLGGVCLPWELQLEQRGTLLTIWPWDAMLGDPWDSGTPRLEEGRRWGGRMGVGTELR